MKHQISLVFILLFCALSIMAQNIMTVHKVNGESTTFKMEEVTEVSFSYEEEPELPSPEEDWGELSSDALVATGGVIQLNALEYDVCCTFNYNLLLGKDFKLGVIYSDKEKEPNMDNESKYVVSPNVIDLNHYKATLTFLKDNTKYYYRAFILVGSQYYYGDIRSFNVNSIEALHDFKIEPLYYGASVSCTVDTIAIAGLNSEVGCFYSYSISGEEEQNFYIRMPLKDGKCSATIDLIPSDIDVNCKFGLISKDSKNNYNKYFNYCEEIIPFHTQKPDYNGVEYVDLGLSVKWATCNLGAESPELKGDKYKFAETEYGLFDDQYPYTTYDGQDFENNGILTYRRNNNSSKGSLTPQFDVASLTLGGSGRIPTKEEFEELIKCQFEISTVNGVKVWIITGPNGNQIILPKQSYWCKTIPWEGTITGTYFDGSTYVNASLTNKFCIRAVSE